MMVANAVCCELCHEKRGTCDDPDVGRVCADCYTHLILARSSLEDLAWTGIEGCAEKQPNEK